MFPDTLLHSDWAIEAGLMNPWFWNGSNRRFWFWPEIVSVWWHHFGQITSHLALLACCCHRHGRICLRCVRKWLLISRREYVFILCVFGLPQGRWSVIVNVAPIASGMMWRFFKVCQLSYMCRTYASLDWSHKGVLGPLCLWKQYSLILVSISLSFEDVCLYDAQVWHVCVRGLSLIVRHRWSWQPCRQQLLRVGCLRMRRRRSTTGLRALALARVPPRPAGTQNRLCSDSAARRNMLPVFCR